MNTVYSQDQLLEMTHDYLRRTHNEHTDNAPIASAFALASIAESLAAMVATAPSGRQAPAPVASDRVNPTDKQVDTLISTLDHWKSQRPDDTQMMRWLYRKWAEDVQKVNP